MTRNRLAAVALSVLLVLFAFVIRPQLQFRDLAPSIHDGIIEGFETFGPWSDRPSDDWEAVSPGYTLFAGRAGDGARLASADVGFMIRQSYDVVVEETYTATYAYRNGQWEPTSMERTTGWGTRLRTDEQPLGFWLPHLRLER